MPSPAPDAAPSLGPALVWNAATRAVEETPLLELVKRWRQQGRRIVLTNGCFDLVHAGHLRYLAEAQALGAVLAVALNDDASTRALKGAGRPIQALAERAELLCALRVVDAVIPFSGPTAVAVVAAVVPDVYVKGGDYDLRSNVPPEAAAAMRLGATVSFLAYHDGHSTSKLIERIRRGDGESTSHA